MPAEFWRCRFFGGHHHGTVITIWTALITSSGVIEMPVSMDYQEAVRGWLNGPNEYPLMISDEYYSTELYRWDGTVNEAGERRMRWVP